MLWGGGKGYSSVGLSVPWPKVFRDLMIPEDADKATRMHLVRNAVFQVSV